MPLNPGDRYVLYRGETRDGGTTFSWSRVDPESTEDDLRPHAVQSPGMSTALVWFRGRYTTYTDFDARVMGQVPGR